MRAAFLFLGSILACGQCRQCLAGLRAGTGLKMVAAP